MCRYQSGTLHELTIIGIPLVIVGIILANKHPAFLILVVIGLGLPFLPSILKWIDVVGRCAPAAKKRWRDIRTQGFSPAMVFRARISEGGAYVAVDVVEGKVAFITSENSKLMDLADIKEVRLTSETIIQWGKPDLKRYGFQFIPKTGMDSFGLSYPKKGNAVKTFNRLRSVLDDRVSFVGHDDA